MIGADTNRGSVRISQHRRNCSIANACVQWSDNGACFHGAEQNIKRGDFIIHDDADTRAIAAACRTQATPSDLYWGYHFFSGALMLTLSETDRINRLSKGLCVSTDIAAIEPRLIEFGAAGFRQMSTHSRK